jgi:hypothetical protein
MSAFTPIASNHWKRSETTRCANRARMQRSKKLRYSITSSASVSKIVGDTEAPSEVSSRSVIYPPHRFAHGNWYPVLRIRPPPMVFWPSTVASHCISRLGSTRHVPLVDLLSRSRPPTRPVIVPLSAISLDPA